ncbi:MAG: helix-turn-helix transcriptional regulator [Methylococcaceae bacterium]
MNTSLMVFSSQVGIPLSNHQSGEVMIHLIPLIDTQLKSDKKGTYTWFFVKPDGIMTEEWLKSVVTDLMSRMDSIREEQYFACLILQNPSCSDGEFNWVDTELMNVLKTDFKLAVLLSGKTYNSLKSSRIELEILSKILIGTAIINESGNLVYCNPSFSGFVAVGDGLYLRDGMLVTQLNGRCNLIHELTDSAINRNLGGIRIIPRPSGKTSYQLCYMPVTDPLKDMSGRAVYIIFLFDPEHNSDSLTDLIESAYGLSKTEARLATLISRGLSVEEYAEEHKVSVSTARTQMRSVYKRTNTSGITKLAKLIQGLELNCLPVEIEKIKKKITRQRNIFDLSKFIVGEQKKQENREKN